MFVPAFLKAEYIRPIGDDGSRDFHTVSKSYFKVLKLPELLSKNPICQSAFTTVVRTYVCGVAIGPQYDRIFITNLRRCELGPIQVNSILIDGVLWAI